MAPPSPIKASAEEGAGPVRYEAVVSSAVEKRLAARGIAMPSPRRQNSQTKYDFKRTPTRREVSASPIRRRASIGIATEDHQLPHSRRGNSMRSSSDRRQRTTTNNASPLKARSQGSLLKSYVSPSPIRQRRSSTRGVDTPVRPPELVQQSLSCTRTIPSISRRPSTGTASSSSVCHAVCATPLRRKESASVAHGMTSPLDNYAEDGTSVPRVLPPPSNHFVTLEDSPKQPRPRISRRASTGAASSSTSVSLALMAEISKPPLRRKESITVAHEKGSPRDFFADAARKTMPPPSNHCSTLKEDPKPTRHGLARRASSCTSSSNSSLNFAQMSPEPLRAGRRHKESATVAVLRTDFFEADETEVPIRQTPRHFLTLEDSPTQTPRPSAAMGESIGDMSLTMTDLDSSSPFTPSTPSKDRFSSSTSHADNSITRPRNNPITRNQSARMHRRRNSIGGCVLPKARSFREDDLGRANNSGGADWYNSDMNDVIPLERASFPELERVKHVDKYEKKKHERKHRHSHHGRCAASDSKLSYSNNGDNKAPSAPRYGMDQMSFRTELNQEMKNLERRKQRKQSYSASHISYVHQCHPEPVSSSTNNNVDHSRGESGLDGRHRESIGLMDPLSFRKELNREMKRLELLSKQRNSSSEKDRSKNRRHETNVPAEASSSVRVRRTTCIHRRKSCIV